jgi:hypothetical protein
MAGSKGKGRYHERRGGGAARTGRGGGRQGDRSEPIRGGNAGLRPEGSQPPNLVAGDATVGEQRRAASRPRTAATARPPGPTRRKPGARGGGPVDRQAGQARTRRRRAGRGDALEAGQEDRTEPTRASTRGPKPRGGAEGRRARARRATPRGASRSAGGDRRHTARHPSTP